jgi:hypothetical protein
MSIWEKLAAAVANVSLGATMGPRFGGEEAYDSPIKRDWPVEDALPFTVGVIMLGAKMALRRSFMPPLIVNPEGLVGRLIAPSHHLMDV